MLKGNQFLEYKATALLEQAFFKNHSEYGCRCLFLTLAVSFHWKNGISQMTNAFFFYDLHLSSLTDIYILLRVLVFGWFFCFGNII